MGACSGDLAVIAAHAAAVVAAVEAMRAAVVLDADARGVIASSDNPRVDRYVEQSCREAGVPVTPRHARTLRAITTACDGAQMSVLREAVTSGRIPLETAAVTAPDRAVPNSGAKAKVVVTIDHDALAGALDAHGIATGHGSGVTEHGTVLSPGEVRMLACNAGIVPVVLGSRGEPLDVGRESRFATDAQRAALIVRDGGCTWPLCNAPPSWCEAHHLLEWRYSGRTDLDDLALLCAYHHRETHSKGHRGTVDTHEVIWTRGDGSPIGNRARPARC